MLISLHHKAGVFMLNMKMTAQVSVHKAMSVFVKRIALVLVAKRCLGECEQETCRQAEMEYEPHRCCPEFYLTNVTVPRRRNWEDIDIRIKLAENDTDADIKCSPGFWLSMVA